MRLSIYEMNYVILIINICKYSHRAFFKHIIIINDEF